VDAPSDSGTAIIAAVSGALAVLAVGAIVLVAAWAGVRRGIAVLTDRQWEQEWARVGPEWTGHGGDRRHDVGGRAAD
jgi:hypothetical protein